MKTRPCPNCSGVLSFGESPLLESDPWLGIVAIPNATYWQCDKCQQRLYPLVSVRLIEATKKQRTQELIRSYPLQEFLNAAETAALLGTSRQALHKNRRISHGFIYSASIGGKRFFFDNPLSNSSAQGMDGLISHRVRFTTGPKTSHSKKTGRCLSPINTQQLKQSPSQENIHGRRINKATRLESPPNHCQRRFTNIFRRPHLCRNTKRRHCSSSFSCQSPRRVT